MPKGPEPAGGDSGEGGDQGEEQRAAIFDMDGLLVDSEPLWHTAEIEILGGLGVPIDPGACRQTKGMFVEEVTRYWHARYPWEGPAPAVVAGDVVDKVAELVVAHGTVKPGARGALLEARRRGYATALASSSQYRLIEVVLAHFDLEALFDVVHSAEEEPFGKPHPGVFLSAAARLGVPPARCCVFEDSPAGVVAAAAAQMACVAVPEPAERGLAAFGLADLVLGSLEEMDGLAWDRLARGPAPLGGPPGEPAAGL